MSPLLVSTRTTPRGHCGESVVSIHTNNTSGHRGGDIVVMFVGHRGDVCGDTNIGTKKDPPFGGSSLYRIQYSCRHEHDKLLYSVNNGFESIRMVHGQIG